MWHVRLTSEQSLAIRRLIGGFVNHPPEKLDWQIPFVLGNDALPLYIGWAATTGITSNGDIVIWNTENDVPFIDEIDTPLFHASLMAGVKRYPDLHFLTPIRPDAALTCEACRGTGRIPHAGFENIICACGGVGWIVPEFSP